MVTELLGVVVPVAWATLVYAPIAHWVWSPDGWLFGLGVLDFAGGTVVHLSMRYHVPGGRAAVMVAKLLGEEPKQHLARGLRQFKQLQETGEVATVDAQPHGHRTRLGKSLAPRS